MTPLLNIHGSESVKPSAQYRGYGCLTPIIIALAVALLTR